MLREIEVGEGKERKLDRVVIGLLEGLELLGGCEEERVGIV